jgi:hypothetical protein
MKTYITFADQEKERKLYFGPSQRWSRSSKQSVDGDDYDVDDDDDDDDDDEVDEEVL